MRVTIIRYNGELKREVWDFALGIGYASSCIYFETYSLQTKPSKRHRSWTKQTHWTRLMRRENNTDNPPLPPNVEAEVYTRYQEYILTLPIES